MSTAHNTCLSIFYKGFYDVVPILIISLSAPFGMENVYDTLFKKLSKGNSGLNRYIIIKNPIFKSPKKLPNPTKQLNSQEFILRD